MARTRDWTWFRLLALAASILLVVGALLAGGFVWSTFRGYGQEFAVQQELDDLDDANGARLFEPDGSIGTARLVGFVAVRRTLRPLCAAVTAHQTAFSAVDEYRDRKPDNEEAATFLPRVLEAGRRMPAMIRGFSGYVNARNQALREHRLGLSEYAALYTLVYVSWLRERPSPLMSATRESVFERRVYPAVAVLLERHAAHAESVTGDGGRFRSWKEEVDRIRRDPRRVPFAEGLPPELEAALLPLRPEVASLACPAAAELEVVRTEPRRFIGYDHR